MSKETSDPRIWWLLNSDPSIRWQVLKDLCDANSDETISERRRIEFEGWGKLLLDKQDSTGMWGADPSRKQTGIARYYGLYTPKWTSTTYTLLLLRRMGLLPGNNAVNRGCMVLLDRLFYERDGGINISPSRKISETCVTGMVFGIMNYFNIEDSRLERIFDYIAENQMSDGGWNCQYSAGATHASVHTTLLVLEALQEYSQRCRDADCKPPVELVQMQEKGQEFLLEHRLYKSDRTGEVIDQKMLRFPFPPRWKYDVLTALDYFQRVDHHYDERFEDAIELLKSKERKGYWPIFSAHSGKVWFQMEKGKDPGRWNTLRASRVLKWWERLTSSPEEERSIRGIYQA
ncbi:MAG: hypothetical protein ACFFD4_01695 [Candidatus Odinarchaeota archaeon]